MSEIKALEKLRELLDMEIGEAEPYFKGAAICDEIEAEIAERYMLKDEAKLEETAVQEYNVTVQVAAGQTIEYNTELRHRCGAATSMSMAFRLE